MLDIHIKQKCHGSYSNEDDDEDNFLWPHDHKQDISWRNDSGGQMGGFSNDPLSPVEGGTETEGWGVFGTDPSGRLS